MTTDLKALADELEAQSEISQASADALAAALRGRFPDDIVNAMNATSLDQTDFVLHMLDACLHGWVIHMTGRARDRNGAWNVSLRKSDSRGDDAFLGHAKGPHLPNVLTSAMLRTLVHITD